MTESEHRAGFVAIIGAPNAGKSTLVNQLVGAKISIVTHKVQTTRARVRGILMKGATQVVLVDTPGIFAPRRRLDRAMVEAAWTEAGDADVTALLVDAGRPIDVATDPILEKLSGLGRRRILVVNKVDKIEKPKLLALVEALNARVPFEQTFLISALNGSGVEDLAGWLASAMPKGVWMFPEDQIADAPMRLTAAELTREKLYLRLHEELPYASTVETTAWKELKDGSVRIEQTIYVERDSQRRIVLGHKGETIKAISMEARKDIAAMLEKPVHLFLFVKVDERWGDNREHYTALGLDFPKS
ncbi:MAG: GTPase Era [Hyphomicrobiaceae bacterium]|mgnify:CR=1 FL=1